MPYYRLYFVDSHGHFGGVEGFAAPDDDIAVEYAETHPQTVMELWCGERRVRQWREPAGAPGAGA